MKFAIVQPSKRTVSPIEAADLIAAFRSASLTPHAVDFGTVDLDRRVAIVVGEFGMFVPPAAQSYFSINQRLYAGNAVLFGFDGAGITVDLPCGAGDLPPITWLADGDAVEFAIAAGTLKRPRIAVGERELWRWPGPRPSDEERRRFMASLDAKTIIIDDDTVITTSIKDKP